MIPILAIVVAGVVAATVCFAWWLSTPPLERLGRNVSAKVDIQQLQRWAIQEMSSSSNLPIAPLPRFVRQIPAPFMPWRARVDRERGVMHLISVGSWGGFGISIGSPTHTEPTNNLCHQIASGVYVHRYP